MLSNFVEFHLTQNTLQLPFISTFELIKWIIHLYARLNIFLKSFQRSLFFNLELILACIVLSANDPTHMLENDIGWVFFLS